MREAGGMTNGDTADLDAFGELGVPVHVIPKGDKESDCSQRVDGAPKRGGGTTQDF